MSNNKWKDLPEGWTSKSRKKFWDSLVGDVKHPVTKCIKKMKDEEGIDDPGAFCAALADRVLGTTEWRGKDKKASNHIVHIQRGDSVEQAAQRIVNTLTHGPGRRTGEVLALDPDGVLSGEKADEIHEALYQGILGDEDEEWEKTQAWGSDDTLKEAYKNLVYHTVDLVMSPVQITSSREGWRIQMNPTVSQLEVASRKAVQRSKPSLLKETVKLAYQKPSLRKDLVPVINKALSFKKKASGQSLMDFVEKIRELLIRSNKILSDLKERLIALDAQSKKLNIKMILHAIKTASGENWAFGGQLKDISKLLDKLDVISLSVKLGSYAEDHKSALEVSLPKSIFKLQSFIRSLLKGYRYLFNIPLDENAQTELLKLLSLMETHSEIPAAIFNSTQQAVKDIKSLPDFENKKKVVKILNKIKGLSAPGSQMNKRFQMIPTLIAKEAKRLGKPR